MSFPVSRVVFACASLAALVGTTSCSEKIEEKQAAIGGSCLGCHQGITDIHPFFALSCVDCHGANTEPVEGVEGVGENVALPAVVNVRDQQLLKASHVKPLDPEMWWPNGIDDNGDGRVDEQGEFFDGRVIDQDGNSGLADGRLAPRVQLDSEANHDMNYLRFINPGDLRVAEVGCGSRNKNANPAMVCHAEVVYDVRRSIMAAQSGVPSGALYGNAQTPKAADYGNDFAGSEAGTRFDQRNPRIGRAAYTFDYDSIDNAYLADANAFDHDALLKKADENQDVNDDLFEATAGPLFDDGTALDKFENALDPGPGLTRTGNPLQFFDDDNFNDNRAVEVLQNIGNSANRTFPPQGTALELRLQRILEAPPFNIVRASPIRNAIPEDGEPITNPVDAALRSFRAYHILNTWSPADNFGFKDFFTSPNENDDPPNDPNDVELRNNNNPFGRFRPSGCTACHVEYGKDGRNEEPIDRTVADNGRQPETALPFGIRQDLGQRPYAKRHEIKKAVQIQTCANCHGFVTRVDYALEGKYELETDFTNLEQVQTIGPFTFATQKTACINVFDNLAHYKNGNIINDGEGKTEDANLNGELDPGEDLNNNGCLDIPDRIERSGSFDGRQSKFVYGGANGSTHLKDVHFLAGIGCSDCHVTSAHGDSNIYTRNWDAEPMECEDCHGTNDDEATLKSSGPNGGDDFTAAIWNTPFGKPWFAREGGQIIQYSRQTPGLSWVVPQLKDEEVGDVKTANARYAHRQPFETGPDEGREDEARSYAHVQEEGKPGGLECYSCHSSWQPNCLTCHLKMDVATPRQEIWWGDDDVEDIFFQLFSYTRSPFYLGRAGDVEGNRIATHRSTMQVHLTVVAGGETLLDNAMVSTSESYSSQVSNPYFPHTVRTTETKSCARCHTLKLEVNNQDAIANDHFITEASGQGTGRYMNVGDWALVATTNAFQQIDLKQEKVGRANVFPGFDFDDNNFRQVAFPEAGGLQTFDVALLRGVSFTNGDSDFADVAIVAHQLGVSMIDVTGRDNVGLKPTEIARVDSLGPVRSIDVVDAAASQTTRFIAATDEELCAIDFRGSLLADTVGPIIDADAGSEGDDAGVVDSGVDGFLQGTEIVGCAPHGKDAVTKTRLHGKFSVLAHSRGISIFQLSEDGRDTEIDVGAPIAEIAEFQTAHPALDVVTSGRFAYVATGEGGVEIFDIGPVVYPLKKETGEPEDIVLTALATALTDLEEEADTRGLAVFGSRLLVADGKNGLRILDVAVPADPRLERTILVVPGQLPLDEATAVQVAAVPLRNYALVADGSHGVRAVNITSPRDFREDIKASLDDPDGFRGFRLSMERWDPLTPFDPKNTSTQVFTYPTNGNAVALAKGLSLDALADKSGRRMRDGWSIGSDTLDDLTVARMRSVIVKEVAGTVDIRGDGLGCIVREGDENDVARDPEDPNRCLPKQSRAGE